MKKGIIQAIAGSVLLCGGLVILTLGLSGFLAYESAPTTGLLMLVFIFVGGSQLYLGIRKLKQG